ncbi:MAG: DUF3450 domain-containing protein [Fibrobacter sp.]|nr:DUF3450 domain-containing protein [Fibrobacter sp.]
MKMRIMREKINKEYGLIWVFVVAMLFSSLAFADVDSDIRDLQLEKEKLTSEIQKLTKQIAETDSMIQADSARYKTLEERYQKDVENRRAEVDSLNAKIRDVAKDLQAERSKQARAKNRTDNVKAKRKAVREVLLSLSKQLESQIEQTLPWEKESRLDRAKSLSRDIESGNASEEESFSRLKSLIGEETRFGDEVAIINAPLTRKNGEMINANILRIGNQWMVYSDENSTVFGVLERKVSGENGEVSFEWNEELSLAEREAVRTAIDVKQAKKPPQIVTLPVNLSIVRGEGK